VSLAYAESGAALSEVHGVLGRYFDALHHSDATALMTIFHPGAVYATATDGTVICLSMDEYSAVVAARESPASRGEGRSDAIESVEFAGPVTALARVRCSIGPKRFTDLLTFVRVDGRWQIIAKVFHYELRPAPLAAGGV
jgi:hypothetical protein